MKTKLLAVRLWYSTGGDTEFIRKEIYKRVVRDSNVFMWYRWNYLTAGDIELSKIILILMRKYNGLNATMLPCIKKVNECVLR